MRISRDERPAPWLNRRDQYRMLAMVGLLCLVMVAIKLAARPASWHWLLPPEQVQSPADPPSREVALDELDFRVKEDAREPLPPDVFRAVSDEVQSPDALPGEPPLSSMEHISPEAEQDGVQGITPVTDDLSIIPAALSGIEDNTVGVRRAEGDAYHQMLASVTRLPDELRTAHADDDVAFTVVMLQPDDYRGRLIGITGELHRLSPYPVMENDYAINKLYEGWMFTDDSGNHPWRFVCTRLPAGVHPDSLSLPCRVHVEGYFFKRLGYASEGGLHVAPTLLAKSFEVLPVPISTAPQMQSQLRNGMLGLVGLVIFGLACLICWFLIADRRYAGSRLHELATSRLDAHPEQLEALKEFETQDPSTLFVDEANRDT